MKLTAKESRIMGLVAMGKSDKQIGPEVGLTQGTLRNLMRVVYAKLDAPNRVAAAVNFVRLTGFKDNGTD